MTKAEKIKAFNPDEPAGSGQVFGLPFNFDESDIVIMPVPWEVTVSYRPGTAQSAQGILTASKQIDLYDHDYPDGWKSGFFLLDQSLEVLQKNNLLRPKAYELIKFIEKGGDPESHPQFKEILKTINEHSAELNNWVFEQTNKLLQRNKHVVLLGGEHSVPLGYLKAIANEHESFGVLQIDAHADLRDAYEGFRFSHASIAYNALKIPAIQQLVQFGIRDYASGEKAFIEQNPDRIHTFFDQDIKKDLFKGRTYADITDEVVSKLPEKVYITFDIDALDPKLCPNTGTPVPGGFDIDEVFYLIHKVIDAGKTIIGMDLCEVASDKNEWDSIVGARVLFKLCNAYARSLEK